MKKANSKPEDMKWISLVFVIVWLSGCSQSRGNQNTKLTLFVAASLTNVMNELVDSFTVNKNTEVNINYASSGTLARQLTQGANCHVYISANKKWMEYAKEQGVLMDSTMYSPVSNQLVLICPKGEKVEGVDIKLLPQKIDGRLAIGDPNHVPSGAYAIEVLNHLGIYKELENKILPAKDVRGALMAVEMGECSYGMVYHTDALISKKVDVLLNIEDSLHSSIDYYASMVKNVEQTPDISLFYHFLKTEKARLIWEKNGFIVKE